MVSSVAVDRSTEHETVSERVVSAVAERTDSDPMTLDPLYGAVDPDALDALFETADRSPERFAFSYCGCEVVVSGEGDVRVSKQGADSTHDVRS